VIVDIGTGDGRFVYQCARENPNKFYIGIEPNVRPLEKISEKIHRKPDKGGAPNVLFVQAAVEALPSELNAIADEVHTFRGVVCCEQWRRAMLQCSKICGVSVRLERYSKW
jgi:ubiquinone/menaquinone biosynthesis C-methylase UbiE